MLRLIHELSTQKVRIKSDSRKLAKAGTQMKIKRGVVAIAKAIDIEN